MSEISNEEKARLEITYLSNRFRIWRGDKGTLFVLRKLNKPHLLKKFMEFIKAFKNVSYFFIHIDFKI